MILNLKNSSTRVTYLYYKSSFLVHDVMYNSVQTIHGIALHHSCTSISKVRYIAVVQG
jgi:hypothetical protein